MKDDYAGKKAKCPCGVRLTVPLAAKPQTVKKQTPTTRQLGEQPINREKEHGPKMGGTTSPPFSDIQSKLPPQKKKEINKGKIIKFEGRIGRAKFALSFFCFYPLLDIISCIVFGIVLSLIAAIATISNESLFVEFFFYCFVILFVISLVVIRVWLLGLCWQRLHDIDKSGWHFLLIFVPIINFVIAVLIFIRKGTDGPNQYGPPPTQEKASSEQ